MPMGRRAYAASQYVACLGVSRDVEAQRYGH